MDLVRSLLQDVPYDYIDRKEAQFAWAAHRASRGLSAVSVPLLSMPDGNHKMAKTAKNAGVYVCGLALSPNKTSGFNTCRFATPECIRGCLTYAGQNAFDAQQKARHVKTEFLALHPEAFLTLLMHEIGKVQRKFGTTLRIRLNMLSDIPWETVHPEIFEVYPSIRFYDYTKWPYGVRVTPPNYDLTYSVSERTTDEQIKHMVNDGARVAVVFAIKPKEPMITTYMGMDVIDGDASDDRYLNVGGVIIGLRAKGPMRRGTWNMVRDAHDRESSASRQHYIDTGQYLLHGEAVSA